MTGVLLLVAASVLLVVGAEMVVANAGGAARRLGVSVFAVGVLLAGAEPEELVTAVVASARDHPGLAAGDAIGANVTLLTLLLGLVAVLRPTRFGPTLRRYALFSAVLGTVAWLVLLGGGAGRTGGVLLAAAYAAFVAVTWRRERSGPAAPGPPGDRSHALLVLLGGVLLMAVGGELAVSGATRLVDLLDSDDTAVGLTLLALATSAELFALVWASVRRDVDELAVAGVLGSVAYNATATLGAAALVRPLAVDGVAGAAALAAAVPAALVLLSVRGRLGWLTGLLLLATYAAFVVLVFDQGP